MHGDEPIADAEAERTAEETASSRDSLRVPVRDVGGQISRETFERALARSIPPPGEEKP